MFSMACFLVLTPVYTLYVRIIASYISTICENIFFGIPTIMLD
nr:MAG TPA: hypothetical protein [Caudoviricetes sp.]